MDFKRLQYWWLNESDKTDKALLDMIRGRKEIDGYVFWISPGQYASLWASKQGKNVNVWDIGAPDTEEELLSMMKNKLNRAAGGKSRKTRSRRRGKSRKMRR